jgi:RNA polymerase sigma-70 factor (ECF subfamily)
MADHHAEFTALLAPERDALWRYAERMCWDRSSAEDCVQEAVLIAYRKFEVFTIGTSFRAWVFKILSNTILNANNSLKRRNRLNRPLAPEHMDLVEALEKEQAYEHVLADPEVFLGRVSEEVRSAVKGLPTSERMVFLLRAAEGFTYRDIADALSIPMGTVMSHLFRARARLREFLSEHVEATGFARKQQK